MKCLSQSIIGPWWLTRKPKPCSTCLKLTLNDDRSDYICSFIVYLTLGWLSFRITGALQCCVFLKIVYLQHGIGTKVRKYILRLKQYMMFCCIIVYLMDAYVHLLHWLQYMIQYHHNRFFKIVLNKCWKKINWDFTQTVLNKKHRFFSWFLHHLCHLVTGVFIHKVSRNMGLVGSA